MRVRFRDMDLNNDGVITRREWRGSDQSFRVHDRNGDGVLSRAEFLDTSIDDDRDDQFDYLDLNGDGVLSRAEMAGAPPRDGRLASFDQFASLDINRDGRLSVDEWHWSRRSFDERDLNRDGFLSRRELYSAASGPVGTSGQIVRVDPAERWTDTGLYMRAGDTISVSAEGSIVMSLTDPNDSATPAGSRTGRRAQYAPLPQEPAGALIAQIGNSSPMLVGANRTMRAPVSGRLYLGVNDDHLPDNSGEYQVTINIQTR